jgi:UDP-N-acetylmuramate-alanine ligase
MNSPKVVYRETLEAAAGELATQLGDAALILVLGAGDVHRVIPMMLAAGSS